MALGLEKIGQNNQGSYSWRNNYRYRDQTPGANNRPSINTGGERRAWNKYGLSGGGQPGDMGFYMQRAQTDRPGIDQILAAREQQNAMMNDLRQRAMGERSLAEMAGEEQARRASSAALSQSRSAPYDPSLRRAGQFTAADAIQNQAGMTALAAQEEQRAAQAAYAQAAMQQMAQEQALWQQLAAQAAQEAQNRNQWAATGLADMQGHLGALQALERIRQSQTDNRSWMEKNAPWLSGGLTAAGTGLGFGLGGPGGAAAGAAAGNAAGKGLNSV